MIEKSLRRIWGAKSVFLSLLFAAFFVVVPIASAYFFDTVGQSARPLGMGEVFLLSSGDANGMWYNPAGLASNIHREVGFTYALLYPGLDNSLNKTQLNFVTSLGANQGVGLGLATLSTEGASELALGGAYGRSIGRLKIGAMAKLMRWSTEGSIDPVSKVRDKDFDKMSFSLDVAGSYHIGSLFGFGDFTVGLFIRDAIMPNISENGDDSGQLPWNGGIGFLLDQEAWSGELDISRKDELTTFSIGGEYLVPDSGFLLRGGFNYTTDFEGELDGSNLNAGLGYRFPMGLNFDIAYNYPFIISDTGGRTYVSLGKGF